ncbi:hypothetical protein KCG35_11285 [Zooshikella sp. WH53]|uniref:DeoR-like transcriptional repressor C-terminal sensor domain-containing protein n=2 Tax=Zooshikella harenae TaxID=2827238 RepID=A0ABS5ZF87_9GAMM|nr:hypothetical protein [Zooshikella harenae]
MCEAARKTIVVTDSSKFGRKTPNVVIPMDKIDILITDTGITDTDYQTLQQHNVQVILV